MLAHRPRDLARTLALRRVALAILCMSQLPLLACSAQERPARSAVAAATEPNPAEDAAEPVPSEAAPARDRTLQPELASGAPAYVGALDRKGLVAVIDQGLGRVLARLRLSPAMRNGRFVGFRVAQIDPAWAAAGIEVGDVLLRLNGQPIERPEQAQEAFDSLRVASEVALELMRGEEKRSLRYRVE